MSECEICGREGAGFLVLIEGAKLQVCGRCARGGKILKFPGKPASKSPVASVKKGKVELEVVANYGKVIRDARKAKGLTREELAKRIMEKEHYLERVEKEKTLPTETIARKLEKTLGIKLFEEASTGEVTLSKTKKRGALTLGDLVKVKKKSQGK